MKQKDQNPNVKSVRVVVARHTEPIDWLPCIPEDYHVHISNSGPALPEELHETFPSAVVENVPNVGREAGHWIGYIVRHYGELADITVFLQGSPHIGHSDNILFQIERADIEASDFAYVGGPLGPRRVGNWGAGEARTFLQRCVGRKYRIVPQISGGVWGGQHFVTREIIQRNPLEYYQSVYSNLGDRSAHILEHSYNCLYGVAPDSDGDAPTPPEEIMQNP